MICENCIHKEVCYEKEEDRRALKHCSDYFNFVDELEKIREDIEDRYHKEMIKRHADNGYDYQDLLLIGIDIGKNIVGKHISQLKGETE